MALFLAACAVQLAVPASMVLREEGTLRWGTELRFRAGPVDPVDPFRGRYVALTLAVEREPVPAVEGLRLGQEVYALVEEDEQGFARIGGVRTTRPAGSSVYVKARIRGGPGGSFRLDLPFDRFYMEESRAQETEELIRSRLRQGGGEAWIVVRVRGGRAALVDLVVEGGS